MEWIILLLIGALIGWLASVVLKRDEEQGPIANIIVGIVGAFVARYVFGSMLGINSASTAGSFSVMGIFWGVVGSVVLLFIVQAVMRLASSSNDRHNTI